MSEEIQTIYIAVGIKIRRIRETLGMTCEELGKRIGETRSSINNIELGKQRVLLHKLEEIAAALGTTPKHLLKGIWL